MNVVIACDDFGIRVQVRALFFTSEINISVLVLMRRNSVI